MSRRMRGTPRHTKCWESSYAYAEVSSWFSSGWGAVASQMVCSSRRGVLLRLLLIWCIRGRKKACCFLVCYHANIILLAFVFEEFFFLKYSWFYNAVLVSGVQQSDSVTPVFVYFSDCFPLWVIEYRPLGHHAVGFCCFLKTVFHSLWNLAWQFLSLQPFFLAMPQSLWDLSSPTRSWTCTLGSESMTSQLLDCRGISFLQPFSCFIALSPGCHCFR